MKNWLLIGCDHIQWHSSGQIRKLLKSNSVTLKSADRILSSNDPLGRSQEIGFNKYSDNRIQRS